MALSCLQHGTVLGCEGFPSLGLATGRPGLVPHRPATKTYIYTNTSIFFFKDGAAFPTHRTLRPISQAEKGETNPRVFPAAKQELLRSLRADRPCGLQGLLSSTEGLMRPC